MHTHTHTQLTLEQHAGQIKGTNPPHSVCFWATVKELRKTAKAKTVELVKSWPYGSLRNAERSGSGKQTTEVWVAKA